MLICRELHDTIKEIRRDFRQIQSRIYKPNQIRSKAKVVMEMLMLLLMIMLMVMVWAVIMVMTAVATTKMMTRLYL